MEVQCRKEYVSVNLDVDQNGVVHPRFIRWANGRIYQIDQLKYKCRAASSKVSGGGIRYTVIMVPLSSHSLKQWGQLGEILGGVRFPECGVRRSLAVRPSLGK